MTRSRTRCLPSRLECVACLVRQAHEAVVAATTATQLRETVLRQALQFLAAADWRLSPPALAQQIHCFIRRATGNPDTKYEQHAGKEVSYGTIQHLHALHYVR